MVFYKQDNTAIHLTSCQQHSALVLNPPSSDFVSRSKHSFRRWMKATWLQIVSLNWADNLAVWHTLCIPESNVANVNILGLFREGLKGSSTCCDWFRGIRTRKAAWGNIKDMSWSRLPGDSLEEKHRWLKEKNEMALMTPKLGTLLPNTGVQINE